MAKSKITRLCRNCGNSFIPWTGNAGLFCSEDCYHSFKPPFEEQFFPKVRKTESCWIWIAGRNKNGYGKFLRTSAHRASYEFHYGTIPDGLCVLHRCDNPPCVRPDHLFLGTNRDNNADMVAKNRSPWGSRHPNAILTAEIVSEARRLYVPRQFGFRKVAEALGVAEPGIRAAILRVTWSHLD